MSFKRSVGRPKKGLDDKKNIFKAVRMNNTDCDMLYYLKKKMNKSESEIFRIALVKLFDEEIRR